MNFAIAKIQLLIFTSEICFLVHTKPNVLCSLLNVITNYGVAVRIITFTSMLVKDGGKRFKFTCYK